MTEPADQIIVRMASPEDAQPLAELLNEIIRIGGTTAFETPYAADAFAEEFILDAHCLSCFVAELSVSGAAAGFQVLKRHPKLPGDWADIATFARPAPKIRGVGAALFAATRQRARELGVVAINATIRGDNTGGLAFYDKMGFQTYHTDKAVPLADGTPVDRISKQYNL